MAKFKITIEGMHCASCASNIERCLRKLKGIKQVSVSLLTKKAFVEAENVSEEEIKKAVEKTGYKVAGIERI